MKKILLTIALFAGVLMANAQTKGNVEVLNLGTFKIHVYNSNDVMADASYIVEGSEKVVLMEVPLFKENATEFEAYLKKLNKPVETVVTDYHLGGSANQSMTMVEGMPEFVKGPLYGGMMKHFTDVFGDAMVAMPTGKASEVKFGATKKLAGVNFKFEKGASTDFPAASLIIGGKVYYTHWTPAKAHVSALQVSSRDAIDAEIAEANEALASGCEYFIGGHGGMAKKDAVEFKIAYLTKMKELLTANSTADSFITAMLQSYPNLPGENGLQDLAKALYK